MASPRAGMRITKKDGVTFKSNVDHVKFTIEELIHAANRDVGRFIAQAVKQELIKVYKPNFIKSQKKVKRVKKFLNSKAGKTTQYWARKKELDLQIGFKHHNFMTQQELGEYNYPKLGILRTTVAKNISMINTIQGKYLTALNNDNPTIPNGNDEGDGE